MEKSKKQLIEVCIDGLEYPIKIGIKAKVDGDATITCLSIHAMIEKIYERQFEEKVVNILNNRDEYVGLQQLSNKLIAYLNSIDGRSVDIVFSFPLFMEKALPITNQKVLTKHMCKFRLTKTPNSDLAKRYTVEIPIVGKEYIMPGIQKEIFEIPAAFVVEMDGFDVLFIEDIIRVFEKRTYSGYSNPFPFLANDMKILLLEKLENELCKEFNTENCSVKIVTRKGFYSYSTKLATEINKLSTKNEYASEHMFI